jgi:hypothetical protein
MGMEATISAAWGGPGRPTAPDDPRRSAPAALRNRDAILAALRPHLPAAPALVLEVASGTGEHVVHFAAALPPLLFQPSDADAAARASIDAWATRCALPNVRPAVALDAAAPPDAWPIRQADAVLCINLLHIAPWEVTLGLLRGAGALLPAGGPLMLYGPFRRGGSHNAPSNAAFDAALRAENPRWGVRDEEAVTEAAGEAGLCLAAVEAMPANNRLLVFRRDAGNSRFSPSPGVG